MMVDVRRSCRFSSTATASNRQFDVGNRDRRDLTLEREGGVMKRIAVATLICITLLLVTASSAAQPAGSMTGVP
jgi:hypothetical protein